MWPYDEELDGVGARWDAERWKELATGAAAKVDAVG